MGKKVYSFLVVISLLTANLFAQAPPLSGPASVCEGTTGSVYTAPAGMVAYNWAITGGGTIVSGNGTATLVVDWTTAGAWEVSVTDGVAAPLTLAVTVNPRPVPTITGPVDPLTLLPATLTKGATLGQVYDTDPGMTNYVWAVSPGGTINTGQGTAQLMVDWTNVTSQQTVSVTYTDPNGCAALLPTVLIINYFPYAGPIDPATIPQFVDPVPHFAAGLRVNARAGGNLLIRTQLVQQVALSTGTVLANGIIGDPATPGAGLGNYAAYKISKDNGATFGPAMWPAQTIEAQQGSPLTIQYQNGLAGITYDQFNILADQTLMMNGYNLTTNPLTDPYLGEIPMVVHLHGGEMPSGSDGGPNSWFMPSGAQGPAFKFNASSLVSYPNQQEATTLWYHPHDDGLTRINVYTGLAGYYFLRGQDEETAKVPGWSGDDLVREVTPAGKTATFNGANAYLPEIELAVQDRMFDVNGQLYWPVAPTNPEIHPFWTPEFVGDIMTVNGKSWPYLSVAPRKYRFRFLDGCNARWLNMWLVNAADGTPGPPITVIGVEGGLLETPAVLDPTVFGALLIGPGQRGDVIIDFSAYPAGTTFTLMNDAAAPYPAGTPVTPGLSDRIMQFVVNGQMVSAVDPLLPGTDKSLAPPVLRPVNPMVKLTNFSGGLSAGVTPAVTREIILNEVTGLGGPASVQVNNSYFDPALSFSNDPNYKFGGPTEFMQEGSTEIVKIANVSADAHPIHIHLAQWQIVSRQAIDDIGYLAAYATEWAKRGIAPYPAGMAYPGGGGPPADYNIPNADGALGGNPAFTPFLVGPVIPANPEEMGWKDNVTVMPGQVTTFVVRLAPTDKPINTPADQLIFPFDPSQGPGYVWHCHIIDHEDMSMMRPLIITPALIRWPQITAQPTPVTACVGDAVTYNVTATSLSTMTYQWQVSIDAGVTWTNILNAPPYAGATTASLSVSPTAVAMTGYLYRCNLTNSVGTKATNAAGLTVTVCSLSGTLVYNNLAKEPLAGFTIGLNGQTAITDALGAFTFASVSSGAHIVTITPPLTPLPGSINSTDAGQINGWALMPTPINTVRYLAGDVDNSVMLNAADAVAIQNNFVNATPFIKPLWVYHDAAALPTTTNPAPLTVNVNGASVAGFGILGMCTGDFNSSYSPLVPAPTTGVVLSPSGLNLTVPVAVPFNLPINSATGVTTGAISLILNVPATLVTVNNVTVAGSAVAPVWSYVAGVLKISWNSTVPVTVLPGGNLIVLTLTPTAAFTTNQTLFVTLVASGLNEIADGLFNPVPAAALTVDNVKVVVKTTNSATLLLTVAPNPATLATPITINYTLPAPGYVTLAIYDNKGVTVKSLIANVYTAVLTNTLSVPLTGMIKGTYYLKLTLVSTGVPVQTTTVKFMIK